jgi:hypothetical protein
MLNGRAHSTQFQLEPMEGISETLNKKIIDGKNKRMLSVFIIDKIEKSFGYKNSNIKVIVSHPILRNGCTMDKL